MPDGTIMEKFPANTPGVTQRIVDRNGNRIIFDINGITDDAGRNIFIRPFTNQNGESVYEIVQKGVSGEELVTQVILKLFMFIVSIKRLMLWKLFLPVLNGQKKHLKVFQY